MDRQNSKDMDDEVPSRLPMSIEPDRGCPACGCRKWGECLVDTSQRMDLFTDKPIAGWRGRSECRICGEILFWNIDPDRAVKERQV